MPKLIDITGQTFGRLIAIEQAGRNRHKQTLWRCRCVCGGEAIAMITRLRIGATNSCGCLHRQQLVQRNQKHGRASRKNKHPLYNTWLNMLQRCHNPKNPAYINYGGRGITVCERWRTSFETFLSDIGERPSRAHSIDRIDNDGPYSEINCRWATRTEQAQNSRRWV